jgi:hypothetical protein
VKRLTGIIMVVAVGAGLAAVPAPVRAQEDWDLERLELMLHGLMAVHSSTVMTMAGYRPGLLTKDEATAELERNKRFLAILMKVASRLERDLSVRRDGDVSFAKEYLQVCNYLQLALESFEIYLDEGNELDRELFMRHLVKGERAMSRLLRKHAGE